MKIAYIKHPISEKTKAEYFGKGFQIIDARFTPNDIKDGDFVEKDTPDPDEENKDPDEENKDPDNLDLDAKNTQNDTNTQTSAATGEKNIRNRNAVKAS